MRYIFKLIFAEIRHLFKTGYLCIWGIFSKHISDNVLLPKSLHKNYLLLDVSQIARFDYNSGIQRVVNQLVQGLYRLHDSDLYAQPIQIFNKYITVPLNWMKKTLSQGYPSKTIWTEENKNTATNTAVILLDNWSGAYYQKKLNFIIKYSNDHAYKTYGVLHDLLPIRYPNFFGNHHADRFRAQLHKIIQNCHGLICVSKTVADDLLKYLQKEPPPAGKEFKVGYWHHGADHLAKIIVSQAEIEKLTPFFSSNKIFLMVGTIEPRKGHAFALDAFEHLWAQGHDIKLCIAGKIGWKVKDLIKRLRRHPEYRKRLFFIKNPSDAQLKYCYQHATALLFPSIAEGFGLPLVEAAFFGLPIIASDIPVFREIAREHITYFSRESPDCLADAITGWLEKFATGTIPDSTKIPYLTWEQSAKQFLNVICNNQWYRVLGQNPALAAAEPYP